MGSENFHAKKKRVMVKLIKGKEIAVKLQTLLQMCGEDHSSLSLDELASQIYRSFSESLTELTESPQIAAVDSACSGKKRGAKDRRGCYKRRRGTDSRVTVSPTVEDGWAWRKYGQKNILNSDHPRCYFRCTHKHDGCKATKQVQRMKGSDSISYEITYFNHHTCTERSASAPHFMVGSDPVERNLISFQTPVQSQPQNDDQDSAIISSVKQEFADTPISDQDEAGSALEDTWQDIVGLDVPLGSPWAPNQDDVASYFHSCETSLHGLDVEVDQLSEIHSFNYFDQIN